MPRNPSVRRHSYFSTIKHNSVADGHAAHFGDIGALMSGRYPRESGDKIKRYVHGSESDALIFGHLFIRHCFDNVVTA